ncbi:MAG: histidine kinase dimerization/phospho-acceptor domain-containing protein [Planctomycetaceae bacterium]
MPGDRLNALLDQFRRSPGGLVVSGVAVMGNDRVYRITRVAQLFRGQICLWYFDDVTSQELLAEHERHVRGMSQISRLAGGMAHEFNNLLTAILGNLELLYDEAIANRNEQHVSQIESAMRASGRGVQLIQQLRRFSYRQIPVLKHQDVRPTLVNAATQLRAIGGPDSVRLQFNSDGPLMACVCCSQLEEALMKLGRQPVVNGTPTSEPLCLEARMSADSCRLEILITGNVSVNGALGQGSFEPFGDAADGKTEGTLEAALAYRLIEEMNGTLTAEAAPGGTHRLRLTFPAISSAYSRP